METRGKMGLSHLYGISPKNTRVKIGSNSDHASTLIKTYFRLNIMTTSYDKECLCVEWWS